MSAKILTVLTAVVFMASSADARAQTSVLATPNPKRVRIPKVKGADDSLGLPKAVRVTRLTPVFDGPSAKAKVLADVDADTVLIAREVSKKGGWIKVEDEDGNRGWVPRSRTNFNSLFAPEVDPTDDAAAQAEAADINDARNEWLKAQQNKSGSKSHLHFVALAPGALGMGATYSFLSRTRADSETQRSSHFGIGVGAYRFWDYAAAARTYAAFLRLRWLAHDKESVFASGPDLGVVWRIANSNWAGSIGYSWGWAPDLDRGGLILLVRPGVEIGGPSRFGVELEAGWLF